jgi:molybdenum cofactor cytidylyltransferase
METTGALILAAGASSRFGCAKQFVTIHGQTMLARTVDAASECAPIIVVAGRDYRRIETELKPTKASVVHHDQWERGMGSSIRVGLKCALDQQAELEALIIMVCDQPCVTAEILADLRLCREREGKPVVASRYAGALGVPALFASSLFPALQSLPDGLGAKQIIAQMGNNVAQLAFPDGATDIDTLSDYLEYLNHHQPPNVGVPLRPSATRGAINRHPVVAAG